MSVAEYYMRGQFSEEGEVHVVTYYQLYVWTKVRLGVMEKYYLSTGEGRC